MTGVICSFSFSARDVLAALVVAPESGRACILFVVDPCFVVRVILGVADDVVLFFVLCCISVETSMLMRKFVLN